jgi:NAD(P)-dependent dehydrogenase (short-subunit alcohol dehydrogenase family)
MDIPGKVAIVTGAGSGIGEAVSLELVRRGVKAIGLIDRTDCAAQLAGSINQFTRHRVEAVACVGDVGDEGFRRQVFDDIQARFGKVQILVPAAGITRDSLAAKIDKTTGKVALYPVEDFRHVVEINLVAPIYWALEMLGRIAEDRQSRGLKRWRAEEHIQGTVVFIGSVSSRGNKGQIAYAATKAGLEGAARTLMMEAMFHGVRCGVIHPGFTDTPMVHKMGEDLIREKVLPYTQLGRLIRPEEIADAICFMIANSAVSGELWADAGWQPAL